jgi:hypothetical protein
MQPIFRSYPMLMLLGSYINSIIDAHIAISDEYGHDADKAGYG